MSTGSAAAPGEAPTFATTNPMTLLAQAAALSAAPRVQPSMTSQPISRGESAPAPTPQTLSQGPSRSPISESPTPLPLPTGAKAELVDPLNVLNDAATRRIAAEIADMPASEPILEGFLRKEGITSGAWKRRWCVLRRDRLDYMKRPDSEEPQGSIPISAIRGVSADAAAYPQPCSFQLVTSGRVYAFQAPLDDAQRHWMLSISALLLLLHRPDQLVRSPGVRGGRSSSPQRRPAAHSEGPSQTMGGRGNDSAAAAPPSGASAQGAPLSIGAALEALDRLSALAAQRKRPGGTAPPAAQPLPPPVSPPLPEQQQPPAGDVAPVEAAPLPAAPPPAAVPPPSHQPTSRRAPPPASAMRPGSGHSGGGRGGPSRASSSAAADEPPSFESGEVSMLLGHPGFAALELSGPHDHESPPLQVRGLVDEVVGGGLASLHAPASPCLPAHVCPSLQSYRSAKSGPTHASTAAPSAAAPMFDSGELLPSESQWHPATAAAPPPPSSRRPPPAAAPASARAPPPSGVGGVGGHARGGGAPGGTAAPPRHAAPVPPQQSHHQHHPPASSAKGHHPKAAAAAPFSVRPVVGPSAAGASSGSHGPGQGQAALLHPHRLEYAKMWVNALGVADPPLPVEEGVPIGERFKSGTLLCAVLEAVGETARLG